MSKRNEILQKLQKFGICGCHVLRSHLVALSAQRWDVDDSLMPRPTMLFLYDHYRALSDQWTAIPIDDVVGIQGCACFKPNARWVFVSDVGDVYVVDEAGDRHEDRLLKVRPTYFTSVKCIANGYAYAAGLQRNVYQRVEVNKWLQISGILPFRESDADAVSFSDIDGFSESDIYACGEKGDLWRFDGSIWTKEDVPTDSNFEKICCAWDGQVYITTDAFELVIGRRASWTVYEQDIPDDTLEEIVSFGNRVLVSTDDNIYEVKKGNLVRTEFEPPEMDSYAHMAVGEGVLAVAGAHEAFLFIEKSWVKMM